MNISFSKCDVHLNYGYNQAKRDWICWEDVEDIEPVDPCSPRRPGTRQGRRGKDRGKETTQIQLVRQTDPKSESLIFKIDTVSVLTLWLCAFWSQVSIHAH